MQMPNRPLRVEDEETLAVLAAREELEEKFRGDCWHWLTTCVYTVDESMVDDKIQGTKILPWPRHFDYLKEVLTIIQNEPLVIIPKSRRMMISWLVAGYFVHTARYFDHGALFWQSETEKKAAYIVDKRCHFIETHLKPREFRQEVKTIKTKDSLVGQITYTNGSYIWAVPQGGDVLRAYTATKIMMDECEFQPQAPEAMRALLPLVEKGAQAILVSSSNGPIGVMAEICEEIGFSSWSDLSRLEAA
jgi:hypothetical protein